ncbi:MAG: ATP-binding cassette domain-containing protein [Rickettsia endosymbiont of Graphium doson]|nr:ATP-binding cassette domain-containing protein [Rickettsia endosymbiont of Graphium doson]
MNDFLFRKNEEINNKVSQLSGGEKARLSLAKIAASTPKILVLDEITNNLDLETKEHIIQILKSYPSAMLIISHDMDFLKAIEIKDFFRI